MAKRGRGKINKLGQTWETLIPWIIAIAFLILIVIVYMILKGKGGGAIDYLKNLLRFGK